MLGKTYHAVSLFFSGPEYAILSLCCIFLFLHLLYVFLLIEITVLKCSFFTIITSFPCLQAQNDEFAAIFNLEDYKGTHIVVVSIHC